MTKDLIIHKFEENLIEFRKDANSKFNVEIGELVLELLLELNEKIAFQETLIDMQNDLTKIFLEQTKELQNKIKNVKNNNIKEIHDKLIEQCYNDSHDDYSRSAPHVTEDEIENVFRKMADL